VFYDPTNAAQTRQPVRHSGRPAPLGPSSASSTAPSSSRYVVQVDWTDNEDGTYEKTESRFYKLEDGKDRPNKNMDINLLELGEYVHSPNFNDH